MEVEDRGDQRDGQDHAEGDAPAELVPDREEGDLLADALSFREAAVEEVRQDGDGGAEQEFEHVRPPARRGRRKWLRRVGRGLASAGRRREGRSSSIGGWRRRSRPESFSSERAIEFIGVEKFGSSTRASSSAAIQKTALWVKSARSASTATNWSCTLLVRCAMCSGERVELEVEQPDRNDGYEQEHQHHRHQPVRLAGQRDEGRQVVRRRRVQCGVIHRGTPGAAREADHGWPLPAVDASAGLAPRRVHATTSS